MHFRLSLSFFYKGEEPAGTWVDAGEKRRLSSVGSRGDVRQLSTDLSVLPIFYQCVIVFSVCHFV